jgi:hypothetical protein
MIPLTLPIHATSASITGKVAARHSSSYLIPSMTDMAIYNPEIKSISPSGIWLRLTNPNGDFLSVNGLAIAIQFQNCVLSFS